MATVDLKKLSLGERIMAIAAVLLVIDLFALPWHRISIGVGPFSVSSSRTGVESPHGLLGLLAALVAIAVVARVVLAEFTSVQLPTIPVSWPQADLIAGIAAAAFVLLKLSLETSYLSVGAWLGVILGGVMAYGGYLRSREPRPEPSAVEPSETGPSPS
jgi:hypothetical protein